MIACISRTTKCCSSQVFASSRFIPKGNFMSDGSSRTTSFTLSGGINPSISSYKSPCGSINAQPLPASISEMSMVFRSVDLPVPVWPTTYVCSRRSLRGSLTLLVNPMCVLLPSNNVCPASSRSIFCVNSSGIGRLRSVWVFIPGKPSPRSSGNRNAQADSCPFIM